MKNSEKFWDTLSTNYDKPDKMNEVLKFKSIESARKYINSNDIVLDFGCATGTIAFALADRVKEMHGIDISAKMIRIAKERAVRHKIENIVFSQSTIFDKKLKRHSFHVILAFSILHLLPDTERAIQRINECLKPGGFFISLTPCLGEKAYLRILLKIAYKTGILPYTRCFKIDELEKSIVNQNFQLVESECLDNNPLEYFIIAKR